jgi:hypothetical protein
VLKITNLRRIIIATAIVLCGGFGVGLIYLHQPVSYQIDIDYSQYIHFAAIARRRNGNPMLRFVSIAHISPQGEVTRTPLPTDLPVMIHIGEQTFQPSDITIDLIKQLGGRHLGNSGHAGETWGVKRVGDFWFKDGQLWSANIRTITWDSKNILSLPMKKSDLIRLWGEPENIRYRVYLTRLDYVFK